MAGCRVGVPHGAARVGGPSSSGRVREGGTQSPGWTSWSLCLLCGGHLSRIKLPTIVPASHGFPGRAAHTRPQGGLTPTEAAAPLELATVTWQEEVLLPFAQWLWWRKCGGVTVALLRGSPRHRMWHEPWQRWDGGQSGGLCQGRGLSFDLWLSDVVSEGGETGLRARLRSRARCRPLERGFCDSGRPLGADEQKARSGHSVWCWAHTRAPGPPSPSPSCNLLSD